MFAIKDSEEIKLIENETNDSAFAKIENVKFLEAIENRANDSEKEDILTLKPGAFGCSINLRRLWKKYFSKK